MKAELKRNLDNVELYSGSRLRKTRQGFEEVPIGEAPACFAHEVTPPLSVSLSQVYLALGQVRNARDILNATLRLRFEPGQQNLDQLTQAAEGMARLLSRARLVEPGRKFAAETANYPGYLEEDWWPNAALLGLAKPPEAETTWPLSRIHAWWRSQVNPTTEINQRGDDTFTALEGTIKAAGESGRRVEAAHLALDALEVRLLAWGDIDWSMTDLQLLGKMQLMLKT